MSRLLALLLLALPCALAACSSAPAGAEAWPPAGVAVVSSGGQLVLAGHVHADSLMRVAGCDGCARDRVALADQVVQARMGPVVDRIAAAIGGLDRRVAAIAPVSTQEVLR